MNAADMRETEDMVHPLDLGRIAELRALRKGTLLAQLAKGYAEHGLQEVAAIVEAAEQGRLQDGAAFAHSLKSSSVNIGAQLVGTISRRIEGEMLDGNSASLPALCRELEECFQQTVASLRELT
jgi:HPt (histidine-containing phosphotransfer) domain-containing protein